MRRLLPALAFAASLAAAHSAVAAAPPKAIQDSTAAVLNAAADDGLRDPDNPGPDQWGVPGPAMFTRIADFNGDGVRDWQVDYGEAPNPSLFCGTGGCVVELWASQSGGGFSRVFNTLVRQLDLSRRNGVTRLDLDFHGSVCGGAGVQPCARSYTWSEDIGWVPIPSTDGKTWLRGGPVDLNDYDSKDYPAEVRAALARTRGLCPDVTEADAAAVEQTFTVTRIPDVNGDGGRDWVVGGPYDRCPGGGDPLPMSVLVGDAEGRFHDAYSAPGAAFGVDIASTPAAFYVIPADIECGDEDEDLTRPCGARLRWNAAAGRLTP
ncbi:MAG: hypothetical protein K1X35_00580 [Caulobacteraceae bacterium]|nr:hypothetical protein [Caulobacteraceae bacterium]